MIEADIEQLNTTKTLHAPAPEPASPVADPTIPHALEGRDNCLMCHTSGDVAVPADHAGRSNDTYTACHKPA
jgi:hypothetical protein